MDPVAHTLFGATLAETGLREKSRYAAATLIAGANIPDIDAVFTFLGRDTSLLLRRGHTHGVVAMVVLPLALAGIMWALNKRKPSDEEFDLRWILGLAFISTWSHPLLDLMNTYGVRLLMPFSGQWFYGDSLFIIDPWFWLLTAGGVVLARSESRRSIVGWSVLALLATALVLATSMVPIWVKIGWVIGVSAITALRWRNGVSLRISKPLARTGFVVLLIYIGMIFGLARQAEKDALTLVPDGKQAVSNPMPGVPFEQRVVVERELDYVVLTPDGKQVEHARRDPQYDELIRKAMASPEVRGFSNWVRLPHYTVIPNDKGWTVEIRDLRYVDPGEPARGIGLATVEVSR